MVARESVGQLYAGGTMPGLLLATLYCLYMGIRCYFQPEMGPAIPLAERASFKEKLISLKAVVLPIALIFPALGTIYAGICTPTEAAAVGALGGFVSAAIKRRLTFDVVKKSLFQTFTITGMVMWILLGATLFSN